MAIYDVDGHELDTIYELNGAELSEAYDVNGLVIFSAEEEEYTPSVDYSNYSFTEQFSSRGISSTQGFDIYDGKVYWVSKSGNGSVPANCYVWNLSDGSQALDTPYVTIYSGHGNNICFDERTSKCYATSAYTPHVYINNFASGNVFSLDKTLYIDDGCIDCDSCIDENDDTILWTLGHTASSSHTDKPYYISKWNLARLTDNGDDTYSPQRLRTIETPQPSNSFYFQGCKFHDGLIWYANGYTNTYAHVYGVNPRTGEVLYDIDTGLQREPEGVAFYPDANAEGGFAMYVGFQGMMLRKYTFGALQAQS